MIGVRRAIQVIGPGVVFAGAAIGVSHLIQATRAGASFGLSLLLLVLFVHALKYPALSFAPRYVAATGHSLLTAYRRQGRWALAAFSLVQAATMFTIVAAVTMVTAAVINVVALAPLGIRAELGLTSAVLLALCALPLLAGGYRWLEWIIKILMIVMALCTLAATTAVAPAVVERIAQGGVRWSPDFSDAALLAFVVPLAGWMPAPLDISVWNSLWSVEQSRSRGRRCSDGEAKLDFNAGYALCAALAACFLVMGAGLIHFEGIEPASASAGLVQQTISLYTGSLGAWAGPVVGAAAIAVMFSTTLTVIDALSRTMSALPAAFRGAETTGPGRHRPFWIWYAVLAAGGLVIILLLRGQLARLVDLATTLSFVSTPVLAYLNHRAIFSPEVAAEYRPGPITRAASWIAIAVFAAAAVAYVPWYFSAGPGA